jgi:hypothetical protein
VVIAACALRMLPGVRVDALRNGRGSASHVACCKAARLITTHVPCARAASGIDRPKQLDGRKYASYAARYEGRIVQQLIRNDGGAGDFDEDTSMGARLLLLPLMLLLAAPARTSLQGSALSVLFCAGFAWRGPNAHLNMCNTAVCMLRARRRPAGSQLASNRCLQA